MISRLAREAEAGVLTERGQRLEEAIRRVVEA